MTPLLPLFFALLQSPIDSAVGRFYDARQFDPAPAWVQRNGITLQATALLDVVAHADREGLDPADYLTPALESLLHRDLTFDDAWRLDTLLTRTFLLYARDVSYGRVEPALVDSQWTRSARSMDLAALLEMALDAEQVAPILRDLVPSQSGYRALREAMGRYRDIAQHGGWPVPLGARLAAEGYDTTAGVPTALRRFQELHGLAPDGILGPATRTQLRISAATRARQIALNLERWRWLPGSLGDRYILVNSAAFSLQLVERDTFALAARAIVGRPDWPTPILSSTVTELVFRPVWRVPRTIAVHELLPIIQRDSSYLTRQGFQIVGDSQLVQEPGPANPLGGVKLVFANPFSVFIHDTPQQPLFSERWRAFSHGCVRVEGAAALAAQLLPAWPADSVRAAMANGRERWVRLPQPIAVHLVYWTAWATGDGTVAFAADPYDWDATLARALRARRIQPIAISGETLP
ncbi:MAG: L,D-transpeptidase family protein [Gemmatimonadales bacterium]